MDFIRCAATKGKVEVPDAVKEEVSLSFYYDIVQKVTRHNVPPSLTMNLDQTPSKFVPGGKATQAKIGSTTVPIAGSTEKKAITLTFVIALNGIFYWFKQFKKVKQQDVFLEWNFRNPSALVSMKNTGTMRRRVWR